MQKNKTAAQHVHPSEEKAVADTFNVFIASIDSKSGDISKALLLIYTPVASGLVFMSMNVQFDHLFERVAFLGVFVTAAAIILSVFFRKIRALLYCQDYRKEIRRAC